jgi:hypothetical protein
MKISKRFGNWLRYQLWCRLEAQLENQFKIQLYQLSSRLRNQFWDQLYNQLENQLWNQLRNKFGNSKWK